MFSCIISCKTISTNLEEIAVNYKVFKSKSYAIYQLSKIII